MDVPRALELLPPKTLLVDLVPMLTSLMQHNAEALRGNQVTHSLARAENLQVRQAHAREHGRSQRIEEDFLCHSCRKRIIAGQTFAVYPDGAVLHHRCADHDNLHVSPLTQENFLLRRKRSYML
eukprot:c32552_g1_i1.p2 GENE.c32552_g1_i1~~c32552_g1_i1.p2  ORF type:complete len:138 (+),score=19.81 c32552_g1_i1:45-416(+)